MDETITLDVLAELAAVRGDSKPLIILNPRDFEFFMEQLKNPPPPNEHLIRLVNGLPPPPCPVHEYVRVTTAGIGFCTVCHSDDINDLS